MTALRIVIVAVVAIGATFGLSHALLGGPKHSEPQAPVRDSYAEQDALLQTASIAALGEREGAIVIIDPQTGRVRALVNPRLAYQNAFPPGSTIKPFTTLAALRSRVIKHDSRVRCRGKYKREDVVDNCSHPTDLTPLDAAEALAYSCNYYFATVGERLDESSFGSILGDFGFGQATGINAEEESTGSLARGKWQPQSAVGEGEFLQVTPVQLVTAYAALFNGGKLFKPGFGGSDFTPRLRSHIQIEDGERATLLEGMRGAVVFGTAQKADLDSLPTHVIGKTGTSTPLRGFRPQGWFVGLAFAPGTTDAQLAVVVYLKNAHGSDAAEVARPVFEEFTKTSGKDPTYISVSHQNATHKLTLEDYVLQVVSAEASVEDQPEALKALAITSRTYALKNLARHQDEGYDFCSRTHCQRFELTAARPDLTAAVKGTSGLVLRDTSDQIVDSYFSASCGGMTSNAGTLWGAATPDYLQGVRDNYCHTGSHYRWTDTISPERLSAALRNDPRTDVGEKVHAISVAKFDGTGRAELVSITGERRRVVNGWDFKLIIGRTLGWNHLKSSRFTVSRSGSQFVFRGGGFGHGLGLCQEGSHAMAQRGHSFQQILAHYFPGTRVSRGDNAETRLEVGAPVRSASAHQRVSAVHFRISSQSTIETDEAEQLINLLETSRRDLLQRVTASGLSVNFPHLEIVVNRTTGDFVGRTGLPSWAAAGTKNHRIELQPLRLLKQRRILETTIRHELVHVFIDTIGGGQTPRWFTEGLAIHLAGEGRWMERHAPESSMPVETLEQALASAESQDDMRTAYAAAYEMMRALIRHEGENKIWKRVAERRYSVA
jgi:stage II sporulation protein D